MARSQLKALFTTSLEGHSDVEPEMIGGVDSMEAACLDVEEAYQDVVGLEQDTQDLEEIQAGLESVAESLEAALEQGGLDATAAQFAHHAVGAYTERLGIESADVLPGLESFGGDSGRQSATTVSLESVGETLKKIYNAIKAAVEKAIKAVTDFFAKIFGGVGKIETRITALKKEVAELKKEGKTAKSKAKVKVGSPNSLQYGGSVDSTALANGMKQLADTNADIFDGMIKKAEDAYKKQADEITKLKDEDSEEAADKAKAAILTSAKEVVKSTSKAQGAVLPGDKTFVTTSKKDGDDESVSVSLQDAKGAKSFSGDNEIAVLSITQMEGLLEKAESAVGSIKGSKDQIESVKKAREAAMDDAKKVVDASDRGKVGKVWSKAKAQWVLHFTQKDMLKPATQLASHNFSVLRSLLAVVESSTKQYEEKKAD